MSTRSLLLPLLLTLLPLTGCDKLAELFGTTVSSDKLEAELEKWLESNQLSATEITCPDGQKMENGNAFDCHCKIGGIDVPVHVEVTDATTGEVKWEPKYVTVEHHQIEADIPKFPELAGRTIEVDCPDQVLVSVPDSVWTCDATEDAAPDTPLVITLTFKDGKGDYEWKLEPKQPK